jgi:hypothetical protein
MTTEKDFFGRGQQVTPTGKNFFGRRQLLPGTAKTSKTSIFA